jgi:hypothetical protein
MNKLLALARLINSLTDDELATISRDDSMEALLVAMRELAGHPDIDAALERLAGINLGKESGSFGQSNAHSRSRIH